MTTLTINHLRVMRGQKSVVDDVSLRLETGRITALLGPNGAGKSSLVHVLAGLLPVAEGRIESDGASLVGRSPEAIRGAGIAAVLEGHRVLSGLSVDDNLQAAGFNHSRVTLKAAVGEVYDIFPELAERKGQRAGSMSGGQQQMLSLGQAIVCRPKFILADEMSLGLAPDCEAAYERDRAARITGNGDFADRAIRPCRPSIGCGGARDVPGPADIFGRSAAADR